MSPNQCLPASPRTMAATAAAVVIALLACAAAAQAERAVLSPNRMVLVDGQPRLIIGLYEHLDDEERLAEVAAAGFNLVACPAHRAALDRVHKHGLRAWINLGGNLNLRGDDQAGRTKLLATVNRFKDHPALLVWEGPDEPLWNVSHVRERYFGEQEFPAMAAAAAAGAGDRAEIETLIRRCRGRYERAEWEAFEAARAAVWKRLGRQPPRPNVRMSTIAADARRLGDGLTRGFEAVRQADPGHILWLNHAPRNSIASLRHFNRAVDIAGCDIYPVPFNFRVMHSDLTDRNLTSVGAYTDRMRAAAPGKAVAMVLQGFGWRDLGKDKPEDPNIGRRPTWSESRVMAYEALIHGASAVLYWGTAYIDKPSPLWRDLLAVAGELRALEPALVAPSVEPAPRCVAQESFGSIDGQGPALMLKKVASDYVLIAVNEQVHGLAFTVSGLPRELDGRTLYCFTSGESHAVKSQAFSDGMRASDVYVYATSRTFAPPPPRGSRAIKADPR